MAIKFNPMLLIGRIVTLVILRESDHGFYLQADGGTEVLLPNAEVPPDLEPGDEVRVFISRDSEDRLIATTRLPLAQAGEIKGLKVVDLHPRVGAFLDIGLVKDLLLPFAEQRQRVRVGDTVVVRINIDPKTDRLIATAKLGRYLDKTRPEYAPGQAVSLIALEPTPLGWAFVVEGRHRGLLHSNEIHRTLAPGDEIQGYIRQVKDDYKIDLSLDPPGFSRVTNLSDRILKLLRENGGQLDLGDDSSPDQIQETLGVSKKAFKAAIGALYRQQFIQLSPMRIQLLTPSSKSSKIRHP